MDWCNTQRNHYNWIKPVYEPDLKLFQEEENPEEHGFEAPKEALWKLLEEYDKVENTDWKKIEITFDGKEFDLQVEY